MQEVSPTISCSLGLLHPPDPETNSCVLQFLIHAGPDDPEKFPFLVLGNKVDLCRAQSPGTQPRRTPSSLVLSPRRQKTETLTKPTTGKPEVSEDEAKEWCKKHGNIPHLLVRYTKVVGLQQLSLAIGS
jgi:hypothetical protein